MPDLYEEEENEAIAETMQKFYPNNDRELETAPLEPVAYEVIGEGGK